MQSEKIVVRFAIVAEQPNIKDEDKLTNSPIGVSLSGIKRYVGFVKGRDLFPLFDHASLDANPRSSKSGAVVHAIMDSLKDKPELFPFKSKGVLLGTSEYEALQRNRFELVFNDPTSEGILDGGHNMLAIGLFMLETILGERAIAKLHLWEDMKRVWDECRAELEEVRDQFQFLVPVELIVPANPESERSVSAFEMSVLNICAARNNNAQLTQETKSNKRGFYDDIRDKLDPKLAERVEWKSNEWESSETKPIKVRDLLALAWIPLNKANENGLLPLEISVTPQNIYRNKGECSKQFDRLMEHKEVSRADESPKHELINPVVESAFDILKDLPGLYDKIYAEFPDAYNDNKYRFGSSVIVKIYDPVRREQAKDKTGFVITQPLTHFLGRPVRYRYPDGLVMPLVYGLKGLIDIRDGKLCWQTNPYDFLDRNLSSIAGAYRLVLDMAKFDPQKLSKNQASHEFAVGEFEKAFLKERSVLA